MKSIVAYLMLGAFDSTSVMADRMAVKKLTTDWGQNYQSLPWEEKQFDLQTDQITISGFSSGSVLTTTLLAMFNERLTGGAVIMGAGPCATAGFCFDPFPAQFPTEGLNGKPVYFLGGQKDENVKIADVQKSADWFKSVGANVETAFENFEHMYPNALPATAKYNPKASCGSGNDDGEFMNNCDFDTTGKYLKHIYGNVNALSQNYNSNGQFYMIDVSDYIGKAAITKMLGYSFAYVPTACENKKCKLHIFFHGCTQTAAEAGTFVARKTGLLEYASANEMVVLFPQVYDNTKPYFGLVPYTHCWESMSTTNIDHPQLYAIRSITQGLYGVDVLSGDQIQLLEATKGKYLLVSVASLLALAYNFI